MPKIIWKAGPFTMVILSFLQRINNDRKKFSQWQIKSTFWVNWSAIKFLQGGLLCAFLEKSRKVRKEASFVKTASFPDGSA